LVLATHLALAMCLPTESPKGDVDTRIVNREDQPRNTPIQGSLVQDVKQINVLLNIPNSCNANSIYDDMINQIKNCRSGADRGHPELTSGCLLKIDFKMLNSDCQNSKLSFPNDAEDIWHPKPTCNGTYCQESSNFEFSNERSENVAFPQQQQNSYPSAPSDNSPPY